jgi:hypothetical protein
MSKRVREATGSVTVPRIEGGFGRAVEVNSSTAPLHAITLAVLSNQLRWWASSEKTLSQRIGLGSLDRMALCFSSRGLA